jgi:hypothetical protein
LSWYERLSVHPPQSIHRQIQPISSPTELHRPTLTRTHKYLFSRFSLQGDDAKVWQRNWPCGNEWGKEAKETPSLLVRTLAADDADQNVNIHLCVHIPPSNPTGNNSSGGVNASIPGQQQQQAKSQRRSSDVISAVDRMYGDRMYGDAAATGVSYKQITKATYCQRSKGANGRRLGADVTAEVKAQQQGDRIRFRVENALLGDPCPGHPKHLIVQFRNATGFHEHTTSEHQMFTLEQVQPSGQTARQSSRGASRPIVSQHQQEQQQQQQQQPTPTESLASVDKEDIWQQAVSHQAQVQSKGHGQHGQSPAGGDAASEAARDDQNNMEESLGRQVNTL